MKIKYRHWTCIACDKQRRFTGKFLFSQTPDWFNIKTAANCFETSIKEFELVVCSVDCLGGIREPIREYLEGKRDLPKLQHVEVTICDFCANLEKDDLTLGIPVGAGGQTSNDWISSKINGIRQDFCCNECRKEFRLHPEKSAFHWINTQSPWFIQKILEIIDEDNFPEALKKLEDKRPEISE